MKKAESEGGKKLPPGQDKRSAIGNLGSQDKAVKTSANELTVVLMHVKTDLVSWNKGVMFVVGWMGEKKESQPVEIKTTPEHLLGGTIQLDDLKFTFPIEANLTPVYLTSLINTPLIISVHEASNKTSNKDSKDKKSNSGDLLLGRAFLDILPLLTQPKPEVDTTDSKGASNDAAKTGDVKARPSLAELLKSEAKKPSPPSDEEEKHADERIGSRKLTADLKLEADLEVNHGADMLTPANRVNLGIAAYLYLESPLPPGGNILTITVESAYNLPPPLNDPQFNMGLHISLGLSIPVTDLTPPLFAHNGSSTHPGSLPRIQKKPVLLAQEETHHFVTFKNGSLETQPDTNYRSKWMGHEDVEDRSMRYTAQRVARHHDDVKYGQVLSPGVETQRHIQFNTMYRVWLTADGEQKIRDQIETYGVWPIQICIAPLRIVSIPSDLRSKTVLDPRQISPKQLLALLDMKDMIYPGVTSSRVLAEFQSLPSPADLHDLTGIDPFPLTSLEPSVNEPVHGSGKSTAGAISSKKTSSNKSNYHQGNTTASDLAAPKKEKPKLSDVDLPDEQPFSIIVRIDIARALTGKPEEETTLTDLLDVIRTKQMYLPDLSRQDTDKVRESFESALARCTEMFSAEYEDFEKVNAEVLNQTEDAMEKTTNAKTNQNEIVEESFNPNHDINIPDRLHKSGAGKSALEHATKKSDHKRKKKSNSSPNKPDAVTTSGDSNYQEIKENLDNLKHAESKTDQQHKSKDSRSQTEKEATKSTIKLTIPTDFKRYITQSGALTKCLSILEKPMMRYVQYRYAPDGQGTKYKVETLSIIHATLMSVMSGVVDRMACSSVKPTRSSPHENRPEDAGANSLSLRTAHEYTAQGYTRDARRLLLSRIQSCTKNNSNDGTVWSDHARWCLANQSDYDEAQESLKQSIYLGVRWESLLLLGYVSYCTKNWDKADLCFKSLSRLFDQDSTSWTALHIYYLQLGQSQQAATELQMAKMCLAKDYDSEETERVEKVRQEEGGLLGGQKRGQSGPSATTKCQPHQLSVTKHSDSLATLLASELAWTVPGGECCGTSGNNVYLTACPYLLALNMFEFAEACIGEYLRENPQGSILAHYYLSVSHFKQGNYHASLSHLKDIAKPFNKCLPVLVLKFHNVYSLWNVKKSTQHVSKSKSPNTPIAAQCRRIYSDISRPLRDDAQHRHLRFLVLLRLCDVAIREAHTDLFNPSDPRFIVWTRSDLKKENSNYDSNEMGGSNSTTVGDGKQTVTGSKQTDAQSKQTVAESRQTVADSEMNLLNQVEQDLLELAREYDSPLVWYCLGLLYLKRPNLSYAEQAFNQANKLDPCLGDPWAGLALVNFSMRRTSWFTVCRDQAKKYEANPILLQVLDKLNTMVYE